MANWIMTNWYIKDKTPYIVIGTAGENNATSISIECDDDEIIENAEYFLDIGDSKNDIFNTQELTVKQQITPTGETTNILYLKPMRSFLGKEGVKLLQVRCEYTDNDEKITKESNVFHAIVNKNTGFSYKFDIAIFQQYLNKVKELAEKVTQAISNLTLRELKDTNIADPTDGQIIKYNAETQKWVNGESGGSGEVAEGDNLYPLSLSAAKTKTTYNQDDTFSTDDLTVTCTYDDGTSAVIQHYATNASEINTSFAGYYPLIVTYTHNGITVSTKVKIVVNNTDSYNNTQLAYRQAKMGLLINGTPIISNLAKLYKYGQLKFRISAVFTVEQNDSNSVVTLGFGNSTVWGGNTLGNTVSVPAHGVGEFTLDTDIDINFTRNNVEVNTDILKLYNSGGTKVQGMFEIKNVSLCYTSALEQIPVTITATKSQRRAIIGETIIYDDIVATVTYNDESSEIVTPTITQPQIITVGDNDFGVSYTQANTTVSTDVTLTMYAADKTTPDAFTDKTATEWCESYCHKAINWGNELDSKGNSNNTLVGDTSHVGDNYMNQETLWGQPVATLKNFQDILNAGFDCVRIPVTWCYNSYTESELNTDGLKVRHLGKFWLCRVREVVDLALEAGLSVMINMHHEQPIIFTNSTNIAMKQVYLDAQNCWTDIAEKFKHYNQKLIFEGYNEVDNLKASFQFAQDAATQMNMLNQIFVNVVRASGSNNANRVLVCPTTVHMSAPIAIDAWTYPTDTVNNHIAMAVHNYSQSFVQDLSTEFERIESHALAHNVPVMITEWGTTDTQGTFDFRAKHAQNYAARAKYHHLFPIWWDNGSNYELVKKYNYVHDYHHDPADLQKIIDGIDRGYTLMKAYELPSEQIKLWDTFASITPKNWSLEKGYYDSGWGWATTEIFPVTEGKKFICSVGKSGTTVDAVIQIAYIYWLRSVTDQTTGVTEYVQVDRNSGSWHQTSLTGIVPEDANCCIFGVNCADKSISNNQWQQLFSADELAISMTLYEDSDITEVQLEARRPISLTLTKTNTVYAIDDTLSTDDIGVVLVYNDGFTETLSPSEYTVDTSDVDMTATGIYDLVVTANDSGVSGVIKIYVGDVLMGISTSSQPSSKINSPIDTSSLVVTAQYTNGTTQTVSGYTVDTSLVNTSIEGTYTITISYTESGFTATCTTTYLVYSKMEVQNVSTWGGYVSDDARELGWTLEKPYHLSFSSIAGYKYIHMLTDASFVCTDITDADENTVSDFNVFVPAIGKYSIGQSIYSNNRDLPAGQAQTDTSAAATGYPQSEIYDSLNRKWIKVVVAGNNISSKHKTILAKSMPVWYCAENSLGDFEPSMSW